MKEASLSPAASDNLEKATTAIFKASHDAVPNVREVCVKCLGELAVKWEKTPIKDVIKKHLQGMADDSDKEVKEKAAEILTKL